MRLAYAALELVLALKLPERIEFLMNLFSFVLEVTEKQLGKNAAISLWLKEGRQPVLINLSADDISGAYYCTVAYGNIVPRNKVEWEQHVIYAYKTGTISLRTALEWLDDVASPEDEMERIRKEHRDIALNPEMAARIRELEGPQQQPGQPGGPRLQPGAGIKMNAAPPVPTLPSTPTQRNVPYLQRGQTPGMNQLGQVPPGLGPGVNQGPPIEEQP
jgi:hypothetical protein